MTPPAASRSLFSLPDLARQLAVEALLWMDPYGDADLHLLRYPCSCGKYAHFDVAKGPLHLVRESAWWAAGLLLRNQGDDTARAEKILEAVMAWQFDEPAMPYHGTFHRAPEEPRPPGQDAEMWRDYDPNWRQFIGTTFLVILDLFPDRLSPHLLQRLESSVRLAVAGEGPERVDAHYTNIAMMHAVLLANAGVRFGCTEWTERGVALAREIYELFTAHGTFAEYNSPTYYGVDLYALRLWRQISPRAELVTWAAEMEHALWRDIAAFYHPQLQNLCGPFDRSYGMDMTRYVSGVGLFLRLALPPERAPLPSTAREFDHAHDFVYAPLVALLGADLPDDVRESLGGTVKERQIERVIEGERIATAFIDSQWMWGGERGSEKCGHFQFHSTTAHWREPDGGVGWMRLENETLVDATATRTGLQLRTKADANPQHLIWHFSSRPDVTDGTWMLPGMKVRLKGTSVPWKVLDSTLICTLAPRTEMDLELEFEPACSAATGPGK